MTHRGLKLKLPLPPHLNSVTTVGTYYLVYHNTMAAANINAKFSNV